MPPKKGKRTAMKTSTSGQAFNQWACAMCKTNKIMATLYCLDCALPICSTHQKGHEAKQHELVPIEDFKNVPHRTRNCTGHRGQELEFVCVKCNAVLCSTSAEFECCSEGDKHETIKLIVHNFKMRRAIEQALNEEDPVLDYEAFEEAFEANKCEWEQMRRDISREFQQLIDYLHKQRWKAMQNLDELKCVNESLAMNQFEEINNSMEKAYVVGTKAVALVNNPNFTVECGIAALAEIEKARNELKFPGELKLPDFHVLWKEKRVKIPDVKAVGGDADSQRDAEKALKCYACRMVFDDDTNLKNHLYFTHSIQGEPKGHPFCASCHILFGKMKDLYLHQQDLHGGVPAFNCRFCDIQLLSEEQIIAHEQHQHSNIQVPKYKRDVIQVFLPPPAQYMPEWFLGAINKFLLPISVGGAFSKWLLSGLVQLCIVRNPVKLRKAELLRPTAAYTLMQSTDGRDIPDSLIKEINYYFQPLCPVVAREEHLLKPYQYFHSMKAGEKQYGDKEPHYRIAPGSNNPNKMWVTPIVKDWRAC